MVQAHTKRVVKRKNSYTRKEELKGVINSYFQTIKEQVSPINAAQEFIDNAFDNGATEIEVNFDSRNNAFVITDNGYGFTDEAMKNYASNFVYHQATDKSIGIRGVGSKNAIISLADFGTVDSPVAKASIVSSYDGQNFNRLVWTLSSNERISTMPDADYNFQDTNRHRGTTIAIQPIVPIGISLAKLKHYIGNVYPYKMKANNVSIKINGAPLETTDPLYLSVLGDDINTEGVYYKEGLMFVVKNYTLVKPRHKSVIKAVFLFITHQKNEDLLGELSNDRPFKLGGVYTMKNGRYLDLHSKDKDMGYACAQRGGTGRIRSLILVDGNENLLGVKGNKSDGIQKLGMNGALLNMKVEGHDENFLQVFGADMYKLQSLSRYENKGVTLTTELVKSRFFAKSPKAASKQICTSVQPNLQEAQNVLSKPQIKDVVELWTNQETGMTEYNIVDTVAPTVNKELLSLITQIMIDNKVGRTKIKHICAALTASLSH